jgi:hypothetical protein
VLTAWLLPETISFAVSFYAWNKVDRFIEAWREAGFRMAGHVVFTKKYSSSARFMEYQHEHGST